MTKSRMLGSSLLITICLSTIAILLLLFTSENSPLKNIKETLAKASEEITVVQAVEPPAEPAEVVQEGIRIKTDHLGVHDILFESGPIQLQAASGPVTMTIQQTYLERLTAENKAVQKYLAGGSVSTVVVLDIQITNNGNEPVLFKLNEAKFKADSGEAAGVNPFLSTKFEQELAPKASQKGVLMIDFDSEARAIASVVMDVFPTYNTAYDEIGEAIELTIPMY